MPAIDIDRETAHQAARHELDKPVYSSESLPRRIDEWIHRFLAHLVEQGASVPGGWLTIVALIVLLVAAIALAVRVIRHTIRTRTGRDRPLFGAGELGAAQHRALAESAAGQQNWNEAIRHRLRAVARALEEDGVLEPTPGRTAGELAAEAGAQVSAMAVEFAEAANIFDGVAYGGQQGTAGGYQVIVDLDEGIRHRSRVGHPGSSGATRTQSWTPVR